MGARLFYVKATRRWLGERSLRAWDLGRLVSVTRWAYADLIDRELYRWDSRIHLPWDTRGESIQRGKYADLRPADILYSISPEQVEPRKVYSAIDSLSKAGRKAFDEGCYVPAAGFFSDARSLLDVHACKNVRPRSYFEFRYFEGISLLKAGNTTEAQVIFGELVLVFPNDPELRRLSEGGAE